MLLVMLVLVFVGGVSLDLLGFGGVSVVKTAFVRKNRGAEGPRVGKSGKTR